MENQNYNRLIIRFEYNALDILTIALCTFLIASSTSGVYMYVALGGVFIWHILAAILCREYLSYLVNDKKIIFLLIYLFYGFICGLIGGTLVFSVKMFGEGLILFFPIAVFDYYKLSCDYDKWKKILTWILIAWLFFSIRALMFYIANPSAARVLASYGDAYGNIAIGGGYRLVYGYTILTVVGLSLLIEKRLKGFLSKALWIIVFVLGCFIVFYTESTVSLVSLVIGCMIALLLRGSDYEKIGVQKTVLNVLIIIVALIVFRLLSVALGKMIIQFASSQSWTYLNRLTSLGNLLIGNSSGGSYVISRAEIPLQSLSTFLKNPLFGVAYQHGNGFYSVRDYGVGNHCEWVDALANYGLLGFFFLGMYIRQVREVLSYDNKISKAWIVVLIIMGLFNPFRAWHSSLVVFFIIPSIAVLPCFHQKFELGGDAEC